MEHIEMFSSIFELWSISLIDLFPSYVRQACSTVPILWTSLTIYTYIAKKSIFKGTGHYFETLSVRSVPGTHLSHIYGVFFIKIRFPAEKYIYMPVPA